MSVVVGNKGSGKNVFGVALSQFLHQHFPKVKQVANFEIDHKDGCKVEYQPQLLRWAAIKMITEQRLIDSGKLGGFTYWEAFIDEVSISEELEARGSAFRQSNLPRTQLIAISRKLNVTMWLLTQLMSQMDKRAQWLADYYILATANYQGDDKEPSYFKYEMHDPDLNYLSEIEIDGRIAKRYIYPRYDTNEVPNFEFLVKSFVSSFGINGVELEEYANTLGKTLL